MGTVLYQVNHYLATTNTTRDGGRTMFTQSDNGDRSTNHDQKINTNNDENKNGENRNLLFDMTEKFGLEIRKKFIGNDGHSPTKNNTIIESKKTEEQTSESEETYQHMGRMLMKLLVSSNSNISNNNSKEASLNDVIKEVKGMSAGRGDIQDDTTSVLEVLDVAKRCQNMLESKMNEFFGEKGIPPLYLTNLMYYIEREDEIKNPTWKRRKHYFFPGIDIAQMDDLNEKLQLTHLAYEDTIDEIRDRLDIDYDSELVYCSLESFPNKPAHFIAVKRDQSPRSKELEVLLVVCGTKRITDVITDLICDATVYRDGFAHSGIRDSGQWIANEHTDLLEKLRVLANKKKIKLTLLGHSLGAGAASSTFFFFVTTVFRFFGMQSGLLTRSLSPLLFFRTVAGIELNDSPFIDVKVVGFGCPALLSSELSESYQDIITTVIGDNDCVPRMSMSTMVNALLDITELDYTPFALRDFEETVDEMQRFLPSFVDESVKEKILKNLHVLLPDRSSFVADHHADENKRMDVVLFPPGRCIHFYSDGFGIAGSVVPCTFFDELDINRRLLHDHLIQQGYQKIFLDLMRQYHNDNHFNFHREKE